MKVRHKRLGWVGATISLTTEGGWLRVRVLWENEYRAWKTYSDPKELIFIVPAQSRMVTA